MHSYKIILPALFIAVLATGCAGKGDMASKTEVEALKQELAEVKADNQTTQQQFIDQNAEISKILEELASISTKTTNLRLNVEKGAAQMTQAEQISARIEALKSRLRALEDGNAALKKSNKEFQKVIAGLNKVIEEQDSQILSLKKDIEAQKGTIKAQKDTIDTQHQTIAAQQEDLQESVEKLAFSLYEAGTVLESIGDNAPQVSWKKNKQKVGAMTQEIYQSALKYYEKAFEAGYEPAAEKIETLKAKLSTPSK